MACEERATSEAVRCRQLEGMLSEKGAVIEGLRHQLNQLDMQRKSAQEKETSILREYLKSKAEADRLLALFESRSADMRRSKLYYSISSLSYCIDFTFLSIFRLLQLGSANIPKFIDDL